MNNVKNLKQEKEYKQESGTDATIIATGVTVSEAIKAKEKLEKEGINIRIVDIHTIKPIDKELIIKSAKETKKIITIEDHSIIGGLGSAVCEVLSENYPCKVTRIGIKDEFRKIRKSRRTAKILWTHIRGDNKCIKITRTSLQHLGTF